MIQVKNLSYGYNKSPVLIDFNFNEIEPKIIGLWGRNGAGKTTLMSLLAGHFKPTQGQIEILGKEPYDNLAALENICYIQENHPFGQNWKMEDVLKFGRYFHPNWDQKFAEYLIELFELPLSKKVTKFSKGMKTATQIVLGLASNASVTILDEPTNGLDAVKRKQFYDVLLESYENNPRLILLSTHHIEEIQPLCESLLVVHNGKVLLNEDMEIIREKGIILSGDASTLKEIISNSKVIESTNIRSTQKVMLDETISNEWKKIAKDNNLLIEKATLQDYLINVTSQTKIEVGE